MAPEQAVGRSVDARSDLFSLGVVLYEMTTGQRPFAGRTAAAFFDKLAHHKPRSPRSLNRGISPETESVVLKSLEKEPKRRYQNAREFRKALLSSDQGRRWLPPVWRWALRSALFMVVVVVLALLFGQQKPNWLENLWFFEPGVQDIAVLPFQTTGLNVEAEEAWRGLFKELTSALTRMQQFDRTLRLVPAREIEASKATSPSQARQFWGATLAVDGVVERTSRDLRITLNLSDAVNLRQLDSDLVVEPESDFLAVKERVLGALVRMLRVNLEPRTFRVLAATGTTVSQAYDHYLRGLDYLERADVPGNIERSIGELKLAIEEDSSFASAHAALSRAYTRQFVETGERPWLEEAQTMCNQALALDGNLPEAHVSCATIDAEEGRYEKAVAGYRAAIELDPTNSNAYRRLAFALARLGEREEAESIWTTAIGLRPDYWVGYYELGTFYVREGHFEDAIDPLRRALGYVPENYQIYGNLGSAFHHLGRLQEATEYYLVSAEIEPNYLALSNLGTVYFQQGRFAEAAEKYEAALELRDSDYTVWGNLAAACQNIPERSSEASGFYERAVELAETRFQINPRQIETTIHLADYYLELERYDDGRRLLENVSQLDSDNPDLMARLGMLYEKVGDRKQAIDWILKALGSGYPRNRLEALHDLEELRSDVEFQRRLQELEVPAEPANVN